MEWRDPTDDEADAAEADWRGDEHPEAEDSHPPSLFEFDEWGNDLSELSDPEYQMYQELLELDKQDEETAAAVDAFLKSLDSPSEGGGTP